MRDQIRRSICRKYVLPAACLLSLTGCAKHKAISSPTFLPPPTIATPGDSQQPAPEDKTTTADSNAPDSNRLLFQNPSFTLSPATRPPKTVRQIGMITVPVSVGNENPRIDPVAAIKSVLKALGAADLYFQCPGRMRVGSPEQCRFTTGQDFTGRFIDRLESQGMTLAEAAGSSVVVQADLTSPAKNAFDIRTEQAPPSRLSPGERAWRVVPRNPGDYMLEVTVALGARTPSAGFVQGVPVVLFHSVSVAGPNNALNKYWPTLVGSLAALSTFASIGWILWRYRRSSANSNR
jgi:hypothetical protein